MLNKYQPTGLLSALGAATEKCGDLSHAIGKTLRWGMFNYNPDLPKADQISNRDFMLAKIASLRRSLDLLNAMLLSQHNPDEPKNGE